MPIRTVSPTLSVRVSKELYQGFRQKASKYGGVSEVMRQLMLAMVEDRLTVKQPSVENTIYSLPSTN